MASLSGFKIKSNLMTQGSLKQRFCLHQFFSIHSISLHLHEKKCNTSLPSETPALHRLAAKFIHISMYVTLSGIAISGLGIGFLFCLGYQNSYLIELTIWSHESFFSAAIWLISLHVFAAMYHRIRHDFVWSSMVPFLKEEN